jgi:hypothetical protein
MDLMNMELEMELKALRSEIDKLKKENKELMKVLLENDLGEEIGVEKVMSPEEEICVDGIRFLAERFKNGTFDTNDTKIFDLLHKNLKMARNEISETKSKRSKPAKIGDLLKIVEDTKDGI